MNHFTALVIGFFVGVGVFYTATQQVIESVYRKNTALTEAAFQQRIECATQLASLKVKRTR